MYKSEVSPALKMFSDYLLIKCLLIVCLLGIEPMTLMLQVTGTLKHGNVTTSLCFVKESRVVCKI